jgi:predicted nucleotidyltransferase
MSESDIDVLVEFEPGQKTFDNFMRLVFLLEDLLQRPVEVVTAESLSPYLRPYIMKEVEYVPLAA